MSSSMAPSFSSSSNGSTTRPVGHELSTYPHASSGGTFDDASVNAFHNREHPFNTESWNLDAFNLHSSNPNDQYSLNQLFSQSREDMDGNSAQNNSVPNFSESALSNLGPSHSLSGIDNYLKLRLIMEQCEMLARDGERQSHENQYVSNYDLNEEYELQVSESAFISGHYASTGDAKESDAKEGVKSVPQAPASRTRGVEHEDSLQDINMNTLAIHSTSTDTSNFELPPCSIPQQNIAGSAEAVTASSYQYNTDNHQWATTVHDSYDKVQPEFIEGSSNGTFSPSYLGQPKEMTQFMAPAMLDNTIYPLSQIPSATQNCPQPIPSSWSENNKRPRDDGDGVADSTPPSIPPRKRQYKRRQPFVPSAPTTSQLDSHSTIERSNLTISEIILPPLKAGPDYKKCPPYIQVAPEQYQCTYTGTIRLPQTQICGSERLSSGTRNKDRHLGTHAKMEEEMISKGSLAVEDAWALRWVTKLSVVCSVSGCDFHVKTWRTDDVMETHEKENHPDAHAKRVAERRAKRRRGHNGDSERNGEADEEEG